MKRRAKGLTLIELMVTLAVAIVLLAIGIPAFNTLTARDISAATVNALVTALQQARMEAISRGEPLSVCPVTVASPCNPTAAVACNATTWNCGWRVVRTTNTADGIREFAAPRRQIQVVGTGAFPLTFDSRGESGGTTTFTVRVFPSSDTSDPTKAIRVVEVVVTPVGQVRSETKK